MPSAYTRVPAIYAILLLLLTSALGSVLSSTITTAPGATPSPSNLSATCEFRTINYITDSLPQLCLRSSWSSSDGSPSTKGAESGTVTSGGPEGIVVPVSATPDSTHDIHTVITSSETAQGEPLPTLPSTSSEAVDTAAPSADELEPSELNEASFLSFEEWKQQALDKAGQTSTNTGNKKFGTGEHKKKDSEGTQDNLELVGDEGSLDLDIGASKDGEKVHDAGRTIESAGVETQYETQEVGKVEKRKDSRSKDAGITCKERFSYASFDAGATVLKTHAGAKNSKAVLIENKDSYMLSECSTGNKFIIIELSEDIWIDTVVLANYEFFSSMVRTFRVSVSDRYPVKMEKWKDAGTYEARNSREIQAFLIENPQIWARYIRVEFLSHYGNEYYCPLSLVRVHGARMLESWKETESIGEDEDSEENGGDTADEQFIPDAVADVVQQEEKLNAELRAKAEKVLKDAQDQARENSTTAADLLKSQTMTSSAIPVFPRHMQDAIEELGVCIPSEAPTQQFNDTEEAIAQTSVVTTSIGSAEISKSTSSATSSPVLSSTMVQGEATISSEDTTVPKSETHTSTVSHLSAQIANSDTEPTTSSSPVSSSVSSSQVTKAQTSTGIHKNKTTATASASSALPTIQESFFKAVSRRLQLLETNSTLSLKYIEEQSKILREAFSKVEKKQLHKSTSFLDTLNNTVLAELRGFRQQYDEIWQSTVISLESQRDESRREVLAISSRLNILADEVVFQRRMSIAQSVLLLLCLGLVIFSRVSASGPLDFPNMYSRGRNLPGYPVESPLMSPPDSPEFHRDASWHEPDHQRGLSGASIISRSRSREDYSPPTPQYTYSRSNVGFTPPSGPDDPTADLLSSRPEHLEPPLPSWPRSRSRSLTLEEPSSHPETPIARLAPRSRSSTYEAGFNSPILSQSPQNSTARTPKKRTASIRQEARPSALATRSSEASIQSLDSRHGLWEHTGVADGSSRLPSPPEEDNSKPSFSIARKPLPALPKSE